MVKVFEGTEEEYYMDGYLRSNLDTAKTTIRKDWDMLFVVDGAEGSGKSVLAQQCAKFVDPDFVIERIVFTPREFRRAIIESEKYQAIVYDEAYTGLSSRATMSLINRTLISMLAEIRQKNLFVFVVMPCYFDLDKYVALWRSRALIHVYIGKNFERGFFAFYNSDKKKFMYMSGKKFYNYSNPTPNFIGRFVNHFTVDETKYRHKKKESLVAREKKAEQKEIAKEIEEALFHKVMEMGDHIKHVDKMKILSMPASTYYYKLKQWQEHKDLG